uniref:Knr4/Smi1-like domain-containing protein n=1 Tax=Chrysotila carterae TaxID=13221 RepID=A0A7S4B6E7_CHRCT
MLPLLRPGSESFEGVAHDLAQMLEENPKLRDIDISERPPARSADVAHWDYSRTGVKLPEDLKAFLGVSDGLNITWSARLGRSVLPLGKLCINSLSQLQPLTESALRDADGGLHPDLPQPAPGKRLQAFDLDSSCACGRVCLFFCDPTDVRKAQVWFEDLSCRWSFIANSFTDYFRLMVLHLGLARWQCAYARAGLDPVAREWCRFLTPERLSLHPKHGGDGGHDGGRGGSDVRTNGGGTPRLAFSSCSSPAEDSLRGAALSGGGSPSETLHSPARSVASDKSSRGQGSARCNSGRKWTSNR